MNRQKRFRRIAGYLAARLAQIGLDDVPDPRSKQGRRWPLRQVLTASLLGLMAGCKNLREVERLTQKLSRPIRRKLGLPRRLPDTTAREVLCRLAPDHLIQSLHRVVSVSNRAKALDRMQLPFHVVAMDGKSTWIRGAEGAYAQKQTVRDGVKHVAVRTMTAVLASAASRPCIDVAPVPPTTNEMGHFERAFSYLCDTYPKLFTMVSYDQGANSDGNAWAVLRRKKHYLFRLNDDRRRMQQRTMALLAQQNVVATSMDRLSAKHQTIRKLRMMSPRLFPPSDRPYHRDLWPHAETLLCVESETQSNRGGSERQKRYYASSLPAHHLTPEQWLFVVRRHWAVESGHQVLDQSFKEDDRPWICKDSQGAVNVIVLRRIAYTLLTLFRSVTQRSHQHRMMPFKELFEWVRDALIASTEATVARLRLRKHIVPFA
jgi:hypothetical protein